MNIDGRHYRTIWLAEDGGRVCVIDQTRLPLAFAVRRLATMEDAAEAIATMIVRGAPLIGATAAYGVALAMRAGRLRRRRSTRAVRVLARDAADRRQPALGARARWRRVLRPLRAGERVAARLRRGRRDLPTRTSRCCRAIGEHGAALIRDASRRESAGEPVNVLTHCNAGWLATVDWGTALAPIYVAHDAGMPLHVWVDETRPRNQGAALTACELGAHGVPHTVIADNAGGHLMQHGQVDLCIVGTDRTTATGDVANKIGTYLKALAAHDNGVPFYVALPSSTIDWTLARRRARNPDRGALRPRGHAYDRADRRRRDRDGRGRRARAARPPNPAFDVTPARLVTGLITERGVAQASREGLLALYPERAAA